MPADNITVAFLSGCFLLIVGLLLGFISVVKIASAEIKSQSSRNKSAIPEIFVRVIFVAVGLGLMFPFMRGLYGSATSKENVASDVRDIRTSWSEPGRQPILDVRIGEAAPAQSPLTYLVLISVQGDIKATYAGLWQVQLTPDGAGISNATAISEKRSAAAASMGYPPENDAPKFEVKGRNLFLIRYPQGNGNVRVFAGQPVLENGSP